MMIGIGNMNYFKCICLKNLYRIGIMSVNINGNIIVICNKFIMLFFFKKYLCYLLYMNDIVLKNVYIFCCVLFLEVFK